MGVNRKIDRTHWWRVWKEDDGRRSSKVWVQECEGYFWSIDDEAGLHQKLIGATQKDTKVMIRSHSSGLHLKLNRIYMTVFMLRSNHFHLEHTLVLLLSILNTLERDSRKLKTFCSPNSDYVISSRVYNVRFTRSYNNLLVQSRRRKLKSLLSAVKELHKRKDNGG